MKNLILPILGFVLGLFGCDIPAPVTKNSFETTVQVVDMNSKPMPNRNVRLSISTSSSEKEAITDANGKVQFNYDLQTDDIVQVANITVKEDTLFKAVSMVSHVVLGKNNKSFKPEFTIKMDTLKPFKVRMKSDNVNVSRLYAAFYSKPNSNQNDTIYRLFEQVRTVISKDTTFAVKVFSKNDFWIYTVPTFSNSNLYVDKQIKIDNKINRDSVFTITH